MEHPEHCDALAIEIERFATILEHAPTLTRVPSCPGWTTLTLAEHLGTVHQWTQSLVHARASQRISPANMELDRGPVDATWLRRGGERLLATLRNADPDESMWAWGPDQHVRFWSRRQLHETLVHRMDLELALGAAPGTEILIAGDAIDEFLVNLSDAARFSPGVREIRGRGERLGIRTSDSEMSWVVELSEDGFRVSSDDNPVDAELCGRAIDLLLVLYRRRNVDDTSVTISGERALIEFWLAHSALE